MDVLVAIASLYIIMIKIFDGKYPEVPKKWLKFVDSTFSVEILLVLGMYVFKPVFVLAIIESHKIPNKPFFTAQVFMHRVIFDLVLIVVFVMLLDIAIV